MFILLFIPTPHDVVAFFEEREGEKNNNNNNPKSSLGFLRQRTLLDPTFRSHLQSRGQTGLLSQPFASGPPAPNPSLETQRPRAARPARSLRRGRLARLGATVDG